LLSVVWLYPSDAEAGVSMAIVGSAILVGQRLQLPKQAPLALLPPLAPSFRRPSHHGCRSGSQSLPAAALLPLLVPQSLWRWRREGHRHALKGCRRLAHRDVLRASAVAVQDLAAKYQAEAQA